MEKKLINKMILNCLKQYYEAESMPIGDKDLEELTKRIFQIKEEEPTADLFEVVNDTVYEFLTG
ncbi:YqzH family protein [Neobacillus soli]|uniref:YqzH family protein n=1 Tax=Neobacillus soli TaxID=220688 RepID=UPI000824639B|nr:YqzH family protein [Neobacillus soli]